MKKNMKWTVCLAAVVLAFAAVWFLAQGLQERQAARSLAAASAAGAAEEPDLTGWDVSVRGEGLTEAIWRAAAGHRCICCWTARRCICSSRRTAAGTA